MSKLIKRLIFVVVGLVVVALIAGLLVVAPIMTALFSGSESKSSLSPDGSVCTYLEFDWSDGTIPQAGTLTEEQMRLAAMIVQKSYAAGLGKEGAEIVMLAAIRESGLHPDSVNKSLGKGREAEWPRGLMQQKPIYWATEAWKKPSGGTYPKSDPAAISRAMSILDNPETAVDKFIERMKTAWALKNNKWRDSPQFKGKPWEVVKYVQNNKNDDSYKLTWEGKQGGWSGDTSPQGLVALLASQADSSTTASTLSEAFPDLPIDEETGKYTIPTPPGAAMAPNGYPVIKKTQGTYLSDLSLPNGETASVAKWSRAVWTDFVNRWMADSTLKTGLSLADAGTVVVGWTERAAIAKNPSDAATGTRLFVSPKALQGKGRDLTAEEVSAIQGLVAGMGGSIVWDPANPKVFNIARDLSTLQTGSWAASTNREAAPPYFVVGDSIGKSVSRALEAQMPELTVNAADSRGIAEGITILRVNPAAQAARTWVVELGTNNSDNPAKITEYVDKVMKLADGRKVFWVNAYRPNNHPRQGSAIANNKALMEAAARYKNLTVLDWYTPAIANPAWFPVGGSNPSAAEAVHPNTTEGKEKFVELILNGLKADGAGSTATSSMCRGGTGAVSDPAFDIPHEKPPTLFTDNLSVQIDPKVNTAIKNALKFVGDPPCVDGTCAGPPGLCSNLSARVWGYQHSNYPSARHQWSWPGGNPGSVEKGIAVKAKLPNGEKNPEAYNIPIGALVYWDIGTYGHVATYVGNGLVVTNYRNGDAGPGVYRMPMERMNEEYGNYLGWAPPVWNH